MKRFAVISDVHANLPALEAVLDRIKQQEVNAILNLGDFIGYGAFPGQVIERLGHPGIISIIGNYDEKVLRWEEKREAWKTRKAPQKWLAFDWAFRNLSESNKKFLQALPRKRHISAEVLRILMVHGSPASHSEHLRPATPEERFLELNRMTHASLVLCGHSHLPFVRQADATWYVNPGSVGRPDDGDPRASFAVIQVEVGNIQVEHIRLEYDVERTVTAIRQAGLPEEFAQMAILGKNLAAIQGEE